MKLRALIILSLAALTLSGCGLVDKKSKDKDSQAPTDNILGPDGQSGIPNQAFEDVPLTNSSITNLQELSLNLNLSSYYAKGHHCQGLKIAILDNGFYGIKQSIGRYLPPDVSIVEASGNRAQDTAHGTKLAEVVYALCTGKNTYDPNIQGPKIILLNTNGYTNFVSAINQVIEQRVDMVLYSQVWEYGGNANGGTGFVNREVNRAIQSGVLWINAAGNYGNSTYLAKTEYDEQTGEVNLPYQKKYVRMVVDFDNTPVKIVLAWNDFAAAKDYRTPQNLDLILEDANHKEMSAGRLVQDGRDHDRDPDVERYSAHAREIVKAFLKKGTYYLRVEARSRNFDHMSQFRIVADGANIKFLEKTTEQTILIPADNSGVLTVGASDVDYSASGVYKDGSIRKPELRTISTLRFEDGLSFSGTSSAAAIAAGALGLYMNAFGKVSKDTIVSLIENGTLTNLTNNQSSNQVYDQSYNQLNVNNQPQRNYVGGNSYSVVCEGSVCREKTNSPTTTTVTNETNETATDGSAEVSSAWQSPILRLPTIK